MAATTVRFRAGSGLAMTRGGDIVAIPSAELCFARTEAGDTEVSQRAIAMSEAARDLLFAIERHLTIDQCVAAAQGAQLADAMSLLSMKLVRTSSFNAEAPLQARKLTLLPVIDALLALGSGELYSLLTQQAKRRLGLLQGFRMVLALERCTSHHEQRALAVHFVQEIWRTHGEAGILPLQRQLSA